MCTFVYTYTYNYIHILFNYTICIYIYTYIGASQVALVVTSSACQNRRCKRCGFDPWVREIPRGWHDNPLQCSCLENPMDRGAWWAMAHMLTKSQT